MPTKGEVLSRLVDMQNDLMFTGSNLLGMKETMKVWDDLSNSVKNKEKDQLESKFIYLESVILRDYKVSPSKLTQTRKRYASGKDVILSTTEDSAPKNKTEDVPKKQVDKKTRASPLPSPLKTENKKTATSKQNTQAPRDILHVPRPYSSSGLYHDNDDAKLRNLKQKCDTTEKQLKDTLWKLRKAEKDRDDLLERENKDPLQRKYEDMEKQLKDTQAKLHQSETDKEYWVDRMSKLTGDRLTRDNPDISDLSDPKRPHKLGEKYSQLYDDEWTDAMEKLTDTHGTDETERRGIDILIDILRKTHESCAKHADDQMKKLEDALLLESIKEKNDVKNCPIEVRRSLKDAQKQASVHSLPIVQKIVRRELESLEKEYGAIPLDKLTSFVDKCTEVCWSMVMQSPRMDFLYPGQSRGKKFDKDKFKEFTRSGDLLDYLVWPAMVTHKQGSLLVKGTVQPIAPDLRKS